jgi:hypothetical protein
VKPFFPSSIIAPKLFSGVLVKGKKAVTPAEAGVQNCLNSQDSRFHGNENGTK